MAHTVADVVALDIQMTDAIKAMSEKHEAEMKPLQEKQRLCRAWLQKYLIENRLENVKTEHGTPYLSTVMSATIDKENGDGWAKLLTYALHAALVRAAEILETHGGDDSEAFDAAVEAAVATPELDLLNRSVNKTKVKDLIDNVEGFDPTAIGVKTTSVQNLNVKRA